MNYIQSYPSKNRLYYLFKMACSPIFGFFRYTFLQWFSLDPIGQVEYYGTPWRCLTAILADLQAIIGNRHGKHRNSLKMHSDGCNLLWGSKIIKKWIEDTKIRWPKLPELKKLKKPHLLTPRVNLYLQTPLSYPLRYPRLSFLYGTFLFLVFGQKPLVSN